MTLVEHVALIGLPGAGKSSVMGFLAPRLARGYVDLDQAVEARAGRSVPELFASEGEERFRDLESLALAEALNESSPLVIACGGGILGRAVNRELLKARARVVWLKVDPDEAATRLGPEGIAKRPLLNRGSPAKRLRDLLESRRGVYAAAADATIETGELTPADVAVRIVSLLGPMD